jgi:hypothetical protein
MLLTKFLPQSALLIAIVSASLLSGCSTVQSREVKLALPAALVRECPELRTASEDTLAEILRTHTSNMGSARMCRDMHNALVKRLRELQNE